MTSLRIWHNISVQQKSEIKYFICIYTPPQWAATHGTGKPLEFFSHKPQTLHINKAYCGKSEWETVASYFLFPCSLQENFWVYLQRLFTPMCGGWRNLPAKLFREEQSQQPQLNSDLRPQWMTASGWLDSPPKT